MSSISQNTYDHLKHLAETYNKLLRQEKYRQTDVVEEAFVSFDNALATLQRQGFELRVVPLELGLRHDNYLVHSIMIRDAQDTEWHRIVIEQL